MKKLYLLSGIKGKNDRDKLIQKCRSILEREDVDIKVIVGNGFHKLTQKMDNLELVQVSFMIGEDCNPRKKLYLIEEYYQELIVHYIKKEMDEMDSHIEELEIIKEEDYKKNTNLYETLYYYLFFKQNAMYAAAKLKIHRNTLLYRVARINELIHLDDMEYIKSQRLLMSMQLERIKEKKGKKL